ncbi:hypothetical protein LEMLEM_LOCUS23204, partial [Lemmus lemmus]
MKTTQEKTTRISHYVGRRREGQWKNRRQQTNENLDHKAKCIHLLNHTDSEGNLQGGILVCASEVETEALRALISDHIHDNSWTWSCRLLSDKP